MQDKNQSIQNHAAEKGNNNDPQLRDDSAIQPGTNTISSSNTEHKNEELTKTGAGDFREDEEGDPNADPVFDGEK